MAQKNELFCQGDYLQCHFMRAICGKFADKIESEKICEIFLKTGHLPEKTIFFRCVSVGVYTIVRSLETN